MANLPYPSPAPLCKKHKQPVTKGMWKSGKRTSGCSKCGNIRSRSPQARERRRIRWESGEVILCTKHPLCTAKKGLWIRSGHRRCSKCAIGISTWAIANARIRQNKYYRNKCLNDSEFLEIKRLRDRENRRARKLKSLWA